MLVFFYCASYLYNQGGACKAAVKVGAKFSQMGPRGALMAAIAALQRFAFQKDDGRQKFLLYLGGQDHINPSLRIFLQCIMAVNSPVYFFLECGNDFGKNVIPLRKLGVRRAYGKRPDGTILEYLDEIENTFAGIIIFAKDIHSGITDKIHYLFPKTKIFCICHTKEEVHRLDPAVVKELNYIISLEAQDTSCGAHSKIKKPAEALPTDNDALMQFLHECDILSYTELCEYFGSRYVSTKMEGIPRISLAIRTDEDDVVTRGMTGALLHACEKAGQPCEIVFRGSACPPWAPNLKVPWKYAELPEEPSLETFQCIEEHCACDVILHAGNGALLVRGLQDGLKVLAQSGQIRFCGCRFVSEGLLHNAGALENTDHARLIGYRESPANPFFQITRAVPLVSRDLFLSRKGAPGEGGEIQCLRFSVEGEGFIGCTDDSCLAVVCGEMEAALPETRLQLDSSQMQISPEETRKILTSGARPLPADTQEGPRPVRILYYSPYPSHPASHGNRTTIQLFGKFFQAKGCEVHFALLAPGCYPPEDIAAMSRQWDTLSLLRYGYKDESGLGVDIPYDGWYAEGLGEHIAWLCARYSIDIVFCSYVFQSKMLEFVPDHVLKVIDTHDKMGARYAALKARGLKPEFFSCSPEDEGAYLRRADIVVARRAEEAEYFNQVSGTATAIVIPHVEPPHFMERRFEAVRSVGMVASANRINLDLATNFLLAIQAREQMPPFRIKIAGEVASMVGELSPEKRAVFDAPWVEMLGFVDDIADFYASVDVVVSPVTLGTGINVKTVQAMSYGMPLVTTAFGCKGIESGHPMHSGSTENDVIASLFLLHQQPERLEELAECSRKCYLAFYQKHQKGFDFLIEKAKGKRQGH